MVHSLSNETAICHLVPPTTSQIEYTKSFLDSTVDTIYPAPCFQMPGVWLIWAVPVVALLYACFGANLLLMPSVCLASYVAHIRKDASFRCTI